MAPDPLDPSAVLETLTQLIQGGSLRLRQPQDALAALLHAALTRLDFRLVGLTEEDRISDYSTAVSSATSSTSTEASSSSAPSTSTQTNALPEVWNRNGPESYTMRYRHDQSSLTFLLKLLRMSTRVLIHASALEQNKTATWELPLGDYTSPSFFPYPKDPVGGATGESSAASQEPLVHGFISTSRLSDLLLGFKGKIVQKLIPGLRKDGYEESTSTDEDPPRGSSSSSSNQQRRPPPTFPDPDDPRQPDRTGDRGFIFPGGRNPLAIGDRDLDPLGGARPPGAMGGFGPPPLFGGNPGGIGTGGGGMYVGPDDPIFRDRFQRPGGGGGGIGGQPMGPWGGDGFLPPGAVPPGARFDPVGPWGAGPGGGPRGPFGPGGTLPGAGRGGGGQGGQGRRGDPDWDDVRPPSGYDDMFM